MDVKDLSESYVHLHKTSAQFGITAGAGSLYKCPEVESVCLSSGRRTAYPGGRRYQSKDCIGPLWTCILLKQKMFWGIIILWRCVLSFWKGKISENHVLVLELPGFAETTMRSPPINQLRIFVIPLSKAPTSTTPKMVQNGPCLPSNQQSSPGVLRVSGGSWDIPRDPPVDPGSRHHHSELHMLRRQTCQGRLQGHHVKRPNLRGTRLMGLAPIIQSHNFLNPNVTTIIPGVTGSESMT